MVGPVVIDPNGTKQTVSLATAVKLVLRPPRHLREIKPRPRPVPGISFDPHRHIDREGIVEAYRNGDLVADISERFGVYATTVLRYARQAGLPTRHNGKRARPTLSAATIDEIHEARRNGDTIWMIADAFGISYNHAQDIVAETGITRPPTRIARFRPEILARLEGGELTKTIAADLDIPVWAVQRVRREASGGKVAASRWLPEEDIAIKGSPTRAEAVRRYRKAFPESLRGDGGIHTRLRKLRYAEKVARQMETGRWRWPQP